MNGYLESFVRHVMQRKERGSDTECMSEQKEDSIVKNMGGQSEQAMDRWVAIPYVRGLSEPIANILRPLQIKVAHRSAPWKWSICLTM